MQREKRQLQNRELFQQVNESIAELANRIDRRGEAGFFCECSRLGCNAQITVPLDVYAEVRKCPGHTSYWPVTSSSPPKSRLVVTGGT